MKKELVLDIHESPKKVSQFILFAIQHILAVLVATITVPLLIPGLPIAATMVSAGIGTLFYIFVTKRKSPVFLSSSFAYINPMLSALAVGGIVNAAGQNANYMTLILGMLMVGIVYVAIAIIVKLFGTNWLNKLLPPVVAGPVIMVIGLSLAAPAIKNLTNTAVGNYNLVCIFCGLVALVVTALCAHYGEGKMLGLIPFVLGMGSGYLVALIFTLIGYTWLGNASFRVIDFTPLANVFSNVWANLFNYQMFMPDTTESFLFLRFEQLAQFDWAQIGQVALIFVPVSLVTVCEHIGDHQNLGNIIGRDLLNKEPGMTKTLIGDGIATAMSGALCGAANTTYGESVAVIGTTKVASVKVIQLAAILLVILGLFTPLTAFLQTIPACITGGVSIVLYGFIASSGMKMIINKKVDLNITRNIFIIAAILVCGIGGFTLKFGNVQITSTAVSMIVGILLNLILKEKKVEVKEDSDEEKIAE